MTPSTQHAERIEDFFVAPEIIESHLQKIYLKADGIVEIFIVLSFLFGFFLMLLSDNPISPYLAVAAVLNVGIAIWARQKKRGTIWSRGIYAFVLMNFLVQFVAQMEGLSELYFLYFVYLTLLILYQDWLPSLIFNLYAFVHHGVYFYLDFQDISWKIYFLNFINQENTYLVTGLHLGLTALQAFICAWWALYLRKNTIQGIRMKLFFENRLQSRMRNIAFAEEISKGNFEVEATFEAGDSLGQALLKMRDNLRKAAQLESEEQFFNIGFAKASEILAQNADDKIGLLEKMLSFLVSYTQGQVGAIYLTHYREATNPENPTPEHQRGEKEPYLVLNNLYAYHKKQYEQFENGLTIAWGEGIVGEAALRLKPLYFNNLPQNFHVVESALGKTSVRNLLLLPLLTAQNECLGVLEIGYFQNIPSHYINFAERSAYTLAEVLKNIIANEENKRLLEETQAVTLKLKNAQEEVYRSSKALRKFRETMDAYTIVVEISAQARIVYVNEKFCQVTGYDYHEAVGQLHTFYIPDDVQKEGAYEKLRRKLDEARYFEQDVKRKKKDGSVLWLRAYYFPEFDENGNLEKTVCLCSDVTEEKQRYQQMADLLYQYETACEQLRAQSEALQLIQTQQETKIIELETRLQEKERALRELKLRLCDRKQA